MMHLQPEVTQARQNGVNMLYYSIYGEQSFLCLIASLAATDNPYKMRSMIEKTQRIFYEVNSDVGKMAI
jgi:hypothetical protein